MTAKPHIFASADEAVAALRRDRLGTVYFKAGSIFVATNVGTGTFTLREWREAGGPGSSQVQEGRESA